MAARHLVASLLALTVAAADAGTLLIPPADAPPNRADGVPRPVRGMSMEAVLARFGEPRRRLPAVGDPPITRWVYERFTVYFERRLTVHAAVHRD